jgi:transposase InsO family protein
MHLYAIRPKVLPKNRFRGKQAESVLSVVPNRLATSTATRPNHIWAGDFTRLWFHGRAIHLATIIDCYTREIVAWQMGIHHTTGLVCDVLCEAKRKRRTVPEIFHSDQGSEYTALQCLEWLIRENILPSWSPKGKPWTNGRQESFFRTFKLEFGSPHEYNSLETLTEAIGRYMHYYNTQRIHSSLKMPPRAYFKQAKNQRSH